MRQLPLTLFEEYLYHENRRAYPCWILLRYRFSGTFQRDILQGAFERVAQRHPLLTAIVRRNWHGRLVWVPAPGFKPVIEWGQERQESGWPQWRPIDLEKTPGFHLMSLEDGAHTDWFVQVHHSVHDGVGAFGVVEDLLIHYARELGGAVAPTELRPELLVNRNRFGLSFRDKLKLMPYQVAGLMVSFQLHSRKVAPLFPHRSAADDVPPPPNMPLLASRSFSSIEFYAFRDAAKRLGVGVHDLFIRDAQAAVGTWLKVHGQAGPLDWVRLAVPVNLRRPADACLPSTNVVSLVIIDRRVKSLANRVHLLRRAKEDMDWVRRKRLGYVFLVLLWLYGLFPGGIRRYAKRPVGRSTFLLTNLGQIFSGSPLRNQEGKVAVPGAVLEDVCVVAPVRPGLCASLSVGVYANNLWAHLHYDSRVLTRAQAEDLIQAFSNQIKLSCSEGQTSVTVITDNG